MTDYPGLTLGATAMRVLTITNMWPAPDRPWYGVFVARQMNSLRHVDVDVEVLAIYGAESRFRTLLAYLRGALKVVALNFSANPPDLIHAHTGHCGVLACLQFRRPVVLSYVGYDLDVVPERPDDWRSRLQRRLFQQLSRLLAATIAKSERGRLHLPRSSQARNTVIPNGIDRELFKPLDRMQARHQLGEGGDVTPWVVFPADPARYSKHFELAEAAVAAARMRQPDLRLKVAYPVAPELMPIWMNAADAMLLTSRAEGSPNVVKEAMACDLPVVSVEVGDVAEIVGGARNCHVCRHDPKELGAALTGVITSLPERSDGRARTEHLALTAIAGRLRSVYEQALLRGPGPFGFVRTGR